MCRIFMGNREFVNKTKKEEMLVLLNQLQKSCGGHGNGVAFVTGGKVVFTYKALDLTNEDIVEMLYHKKTTKPEWFFYHTRVASAGSIKSENCHPYVNEENDFMIQMNGTEYDFGLLGKDRDITDTQVIFEIYNSTGYDVSGLRLLSPRFMGLSKGKVFATNPTSSLLKFYKKDGAFAIASEFEPGRENVKTMKRSYVWFEGTEIEEEPVVERKTYAISSYQDYGYYLGNRYNKGNNRWNGVPSDCEACTVDEAIDVDEEYNQGFVTEQGGLSEIELELEEFGLSSFSKFTKASISKSSFLDRLDLLETVCQYYLPDEYYGEEIIKHFFTSNLKVLNEKGEITEYQNYYTDGSIILSCETGNSIVVDKFGSILL